MKKYSNEEILKLIKEAPGPVRKVIEDVQTAFTIADFSQKYSLHIDQIGSLAELNRNMLLGLIGPEEFLKELVATVKVQDAQAREIMAEINTKIFVPLREEMRNAVGVPKTPVQSVAPMARPARAPVSVPVPTPARVSTSAPSRTFSKQIPPPPQTQPQAPARSAPPPSIIKFIPDGAKSVLRQPQPLVHTSNPAIAPLPPKLSLPGVPQALRPIARGASPVNTINHPPLPTPQSGLRPPVIVPPPASPKPTPPPIPKPPAPSSYTTDPYREPIDEK